MSEKLTKKKATMKRPQKILGPSQASQGSGVPSGAPSKRLRIISKSRGAAQSGMWSQSSSRQLFSGVA